MHQGAILGDIDVAQLAVIAFFIFFGGLIIHLRREDKREGYPLKDPAGGHDQVGWPDMPPPKTFVLINGDEVTAPHAEHPEPVAGRPEYGAPGDALVPTGDPLADGIGPAAYPLRRQTPMLIYGGEVQVAPMRVLPGWSIAEGDTDPRGMAVIGADGVAAGVVRDLWLDRGVKILRYLEVELTASADGRPALLPIYHTDISRRQGRVRVRAVRAAQFELCPRLADPHRITAREEDQVNAFYAGARFFGEQAGQEASL
jgi:photosynthetic reaction center H subunit